MSAQKAPRTSSCGFTDEELIVFQNHKEQLMKKTIAQLGALLAKNGMPKSGKKDELVDRVAECKALGVPPTCPLCDRVKLRFSRDSGKFSCPGYFDDEKKAFQR